MPKEHIEETSVPEPSPTPSPLEPQIDDTLVVETSAIDHSAQGSVEQYSEKLNEELDKSGKSEPNDNAVSSLQGEEAAEPGKFELEDNVGGSPEYEPESSNEGQNYRGSTSLNSANDPQNVDSSPSEQSPLILLDPESSSVEFFRAEGDCIDRLDKATDFERFYTAFTSDLLTDVRRDEWCTDLRKKQKEMLDDPNNSSVHISFLLGELRLKTIKHALEAFHTKQEKYKEAAKAAFELHQGLTSAYGDYVFKECSSGDFLKRSEDLIKEARPVLENHRGYKKLFLDIVNAILLVASLGVSYTRSNSWRFFEAKTASMELVDKIEDAAKKIPTSK